MTGTGSGTGNGNGRDWATLTDEALADEIASNRRSERRLVLVVGLIAAALAVAALILHGPIT